MASASPSQRIADSKPGTTVMWLLYAAFVFLLTAAADGKWHSFFLPAMPVAMAMGVFIIALIRGTKLPKLNVLSWLTLAGAAYFATRAWFSPDLFDRWSDMALIMAGCAFYILGYVFLLSGKRDRLFYGMVSFCLVGGVIVLAAQYLFHSPFPILRPSLNFNLNDVGNVGWFGYKNFMGHFLVAGGMFCCANAIFRGVSGWNWLLAGLLSLAASFACGSKAIIPNMIVGMLIIWALYLCKIRQRNTKFYVALFSGSLAFLSLVGIALLSLIHNSALMQSLSTLWTDGGRFQMTEIALQAARQAPFFGHGALSFENEAIPYFKFLASPNLAHNEYAQCLCDYGLVGLIILTGLLAAHLITGFRHILTMREDAPLQAGRIAGAICLLATAAMHASMEFIWHNGAIVAMGAFCAGMISAGAPGRQKAGGRINNTVLMGGSLLLCAFFTTLAIKSFPVWRNEWKLGSLPQNDIRGKWEILRKTVAITSDPKIANSYASNIAFIEELQGAIPPSELKFTETALRKALESSPKNHYSKTYLGIILNQEGKFEEADRILRPFVGDPNLFSNGIFPWEAVYVNHLSRWADSIANDTPAKALSIIREAQSMLPLPYIWGKPSKTNEFKNKFELQEMILESQGVTVPDDSWKK